MKMLLKISALFLALGVLTFVACKKENNTDIKPNTVDESRFFKGVSLNDGMLIFKEESNIQMLSESMLHDRAAAEEVLNAQFPSFKSNNKAYNELMSKLDLDKVDEKTVDENSNLICLVPEGEDKRLRKTMDSHFLSCIANENGSFQVGNTIFKITADMVYEYDAISKVEKKKTPIIRKTEEGPRGPGIASDLFYDCNTGSGSINKKLRSALFFGLYGSYSEAGANAENTRLNSAGIRVGFNVQFINTRGSYRVFRSQIFGGTLCSVTTFTPDKNKTNASFVEEVGTSCWTCCNSMSFIGSITASIDGNNTCGFKTVTVTF